MPGEQRTIEGEQCTDGRVEGAMEREAVRRKEQRASSVGGGVLGVWVYGDIERVAEEGALLLRGGGGDRVVQDGV